MRKYGVIIFFKSRLLFTAQQFLDKVLVRSTRLEPVKATSAMRRGDAVNSSKPEHKKGDDI